MADSKKEQECAELHRTIWGIANDLRGSVDGWDFKQYILGMLFYRFISENLTNYINEGEHKAGNTILITLIYPTTKPRRFAKIWLILRVFYSAESTFKNVRKNAKNDENLNETLEKALNSIEDSAKGHDSEYDMKGLFDDLDVNSDKLGNSVAKRNEHLVQLMDGVGDMKLGNYQDNTIDAFGDAYEYLMGMYASSVGKSGGEYYTPQEVSELLTKLAIMGKTSVNKVYDPACGSRVIIMTEANSSVKSKVFKLLPKLKTEETGNLCVA